MLFVAESSSSGSDLESSSSESEHEENMSSVRQPSPPKLLTEQEMNQLGAKLVKAEIMGNQVNTGLNSSFLDYKNIMNVTL